MQYIYKGYTDLYSGYQGQPYCQADMWPPATEYLPPYLGMALGGMPPVEMPSTDQKLGMYQGVTINLVTLLLEGLIHPRI